MADRPIPFSPPMVRALLAGTKTQTRRGNHLERLRRFGPTTQFGRSDTHGYDWHFRDKGMRWHDLRHAELLKALPYQSGDRLYVREPWRTESAFDDVAPRDLTPDGQQWRYEADGAWSDRDAMTGSAGRFRQGMHMPRWASRITLTVTDVRVERLQDISDADAIAEGIEDVTREVAAGNPSLRFWKRYRDGGWNGYVDTAVGSYASLWTEINGAGSWETNPWVAAYSFTVERGNIDQIARAA